MSSSPYPGAGGRHRAVALKPDDIQVETRGEIPAAAVEDARAIVAELTAIAHEPVLYARVKLVASADPAVARPITAQANLDVNGRLVRAQAPAESAWQAVRLLGDRLRVRLRRGSRDWEDLRGRRPQDADHEWRRSSPPRRPLPYFPRPEEGRRIIRHKTFELTRAIPDEAAFDMEQLDYDFHLFTEADTDQDSVLYRVDEGYRLAQVEPRPNGLGPVSVPLTVSPVPAPVLTVEQAVERLELSRWPFVFFTDAGTGRGNIVYHRYDGHYGLITPSD